MQLTINTTQNVKIYFKQAPLSSRVIAALIDSCCLFLYGIGVLFFWNKLNLASYFSDDFTMYGVIVILLLPAIFYSVLAETLFKGKSLGKALMKIRVVKIDGYHATFVDYLTRWIFRSIDVLIGSGVIGLITILISNKGQRLGDLVAGTALISTKNNIGLSSTIYEEVGESYSVTYHQVLKLSDNDVRLIKEVMEEFKRTRNQLLLNKLVEKIEKSVGVKNKTESHIQFINCIIKDYNYLSQQKA